MASDEPENPFGRRGFPDLGGSDAPGIFQQLGSSVAKLKQIATRKFNPTTDKGCRRTIAFNKELDSLRDGEKATFIPVPENASPGSDIVVDLPNGQQVVVKIPEGVQPGDVLQVNAKMQLVRNVPGHSTPDDEHEWDENDPAAGCPLMWRTYGLTPSGLYHHYRNYWWGWLYATFLYIMSIPIHFLKTFDWNGIRRVYYGPPSEEEPLRKRGVQSKVVINYMLYRRSNIVMCVCFILPIIYCTVRAIIDQEAEMQDHIQKAKNVPTFAQFTLTQTAIGLNASFPTYAVDVLANGYGSIGIWSDRLWVCRHIVRLTFLCIAFFCCFTSMLRWDDFKFSRYRLVYAWLAMLVAPFAAALIPSRSFVDWQLFDTIMRDLIQEGRAHYKVDELAATCLYAEPSVTLVTVAYYVKTVCDVINSNVPYVMPGSIDMVTRLGTIPIPLQSLPFVGEQLPNEGTDLKTLHSTCQQMKSIGENEFTHDAVAGVYQGCRIAATYLYDNTPDTQKTAFQGYKDRLSQELHVDPTHIQGDHAMRFWTSKPKVGIPELVGIQYMSEKQPTGRVVRRDENPEGCSPYASNTSLLSQAELFLIGPIPEKPACDLKLMASNAYTAGAAGIVIYGAKDYNGDLTPPFPLDDLKAVTTIPIAVLSSHVDGKILSHALKGKPTDEGLTNTIEPYTPQYKPLQGRTSNGCRCKGRGFDSECKVRDPGLFSESRKLDEKDKYPWCETASPCPVSYDLCVPADMVMAVKKESSTPWPCKSNLPCRRKHAGIHGITDNPYTWKAYSKQEKCATYYSPGRFRDSITWIDCVGPDGLIGTTTLADGAPTKDVKGIQVSFPPGMHEVKLRGILITAPDCSYRLRVEDSAGVSDATVQLKFGKDTFANMEPALASEEDEQDIEINVLANKGKHLGAVVFEKKCATTVKEVRTEPAQWTTIPVSDFRYVPLPNADGRSLLQQNMSLHIVHRGQHDVTLDNRSLVDLHSGEQQASRHNAKVQRQKMGSRLARSKRSIRKTGSVRRHILAGLAAEPDDPDPENATENINTAVVTKVPVEPKAPAVVLKTDPPADPASSNVLWTCEVFVGGKCNTKRRCGDNEVCDSVGNDQHTGGHCYCSPGHCFSHTKLGCVPEPVHAKEMVAHLLDESLYKDDVMKALNTGKVAASIMISVQEGIANLNSIIGHVLAIGPGMLISAWTAKLIFAHSTIPAYFCYFFPWIYSPMAWAVYNVYYQILPDLRLFCGLAILSFWPIIMAGITLSYGLHKQMRTARLMHVVNTLLVTYYSILLVGYGCLAAFALGFNPDGNDHINESLRGKYSFANYIRDRADSLRNDPSTFAKDTNFLTMWLIDSFATFFFTCCAVTDAFIVMISQEHNEAWLMHHQTQAMNDKAKLNREERPSLGRTPSMEDAMNQYYIGTRAHLLKDEGVADIHGVYEECVIKDWLLLINDVELTVPKSPPRPAGEQQSVQMEAKAGADSGEPDAEATLQAMLQAGDPSTDSTALGKSFATDEGR